MYTTFVSYKNEEKASSEQKKLPFHKTLDKFREELKNIALENGAKVLDLQTVFNEAQKTFKPEELAIDGIHPTNLGHKVIADAIEKVFEFSNQNCV